MSAQAMAEWKFSAAVSALCLPALDVAGNGTRDRTDGGAAQPCRRKGRLSRHRPLHRALHRKRYPAVPWSCSYRPPSYRAPVPAMYKCIFCSSLLPQRFHSRQGHLEIQHLEHRPFQLFGITAVVGVELCDHVREYRRPIAHSGERDTMLRPRIAARLSPAIACSTSNTLPIPIRNARFCARSAVVQCSPVTSGRSCGVLLGGPGRDRQRQQHYRYKRNKQSLHANSFLDLTR